MKPGSVPYLIIADQYQRPSEPGQFDQSGNYTEGPYQLAHGDWLYIFYSRGNCCAPGSFDISTVYQTQVCRTPIGNGPAGPYVDRNGESCARGSYYRHGSIFLYSNSKSTNSTTPYPMLTGVVQTKTAIELQSLRLVQWALSMTLTRVCACGISVSWEIKLEVTIT